MSLWFCPISQRKAHVHLSWDTEHSVEMSVLENTKTYLMDRLLECRATLAPTEQEVINRKSHPKNAKRPIDPSYSYHAKSKKAHSKVKSEFEARSSGEDNESDGRKSTHVDSDKWQVTRAEDMVTVRASNHIPGEVLTLWP